MACPSKIDCFRTLTFSRSATLKIGNYILNLNTRDKGLELNGNVRLELRRIRNIRWRIEKEEKKG